MIIATESYDTVHKKYSEAIAWMNMLGVKIGPGRTAHYERVVGLWKDAYKTASSEQGKELFPDFVSSMFEIHDFIDIHQAFKAVTPNQLHSIIQKLQKAVNGPVNAAEETPKSTTARNFLFEAIVAARSHRPQENVRAILDAVSDTGISINNRKIWIECKRVTNPDKIERNVRKASDQLETILNKQVGSGHRGIVAIEVSKILQPGDKILVKDNDSELLASIDQIMDQFITQYSRIWERVYARRSKKIIGTIIRFAFMSSSEARNILVHTSQWAVNPRASISSSDESIQKHLVSTLQAAP